MDLACKMNLGSSAFALERKSSASRSLSSSGAPPFEFGNFMCDRQFNGCGARQVSDLNKFPTLSVRVIRWDSPLESERHKVISLRLQRQVVESHLHF